MKDFSKKTNKNKIVLSKKFFQRPAKIVVKELLGKFLVRRLDDGRILAEKIIEVEIYDGPEDRASHASRLGPKKRLRNNEGRTKRTAPMFEAGGIFYINLCYGMYQMLNVVVDNKDYPATILIRATEETKGPGRLTRKFAIDGSLNAKPASRKTGLWFEDRKEKITPQKIIRGPRTGVDYAGKVWKNKKYKFSLKT